MILIVIFSTVFLFISSILILLQLPIKVNLFRTLLIYIRIKSISLNISLNYLCANILNKGVLTQFQNPLIPCPGILFMSNSTQTIYWIPAFIAAIFINTLLLFKRIISLKPSIGNQGSNNTDG